MPPHPTSVRVPEAGGRAPRGAVARADTGLRLARAAVFTALCVLLSAAGHVLASCQAVPLWTLPVACVAVFAVAAPLAGRERSLPGIAVMLAVGQLALHALFCTAQRSTMAGMNGMPGTNGTAGGAVPAGGRGGTAALAHQLLCGAGGHRLDAAQAHALVAHAGLTSHVASARLAGGALGGRAAAALDRATSGHGATGQGSSGTGGVHGALLPDCHASLLAGLLPSLPMVLGHLLAAVAAGWLLRRGEVAVWRAVRLSARSARAAAEEALVRSLRAVLGLVRALRLGAPGARRRRISAPRTHRRSEPRPRILALQHSVIRRGPPRPALAV